MGNRTIFSTVRVDMPEGHTISAVRGVSRDELVERIARGEIFLEEDEALAVKVFFGITVTPGNIVEKTHLREGDLVIRPAPEIFEGKIPPEHDFREYEILVLIPSRHSTDMGRCMHKTKG